MGTDHRALTRARTLPRAVMPSKALEELYFRCFKGVLMQER